MNTLKNLPWKNFENKNRLHSICSYMAMFPPGLPNHFIKKYSKKGEIVFDPFSGRGTTVLEACFMNRVGIGNDLNPLAYLLTKAKSYIPSEKRIISRLNALEKEFKQTNKISISKENPRIKMIFSNYTLRQLIFLKKRLVWKKNNLDAFITALLLGIIHGNSEGYLSLKMPNTFSMSPNYIKNYISEHKLTKPKRDVFHLLKKKLNRCYQKPLKKGRAYMKDAKRIKPLKDSSIDLIMTSPPYTRVIKYGQFNWIRLWFLGENEKEVDKDLFFSQSKEKYCEFMLEVLEEMKRILKPQRKLVLVIGDVNDKNTKKPYNLAGKIWKECASPLGFKLVEPIHKDIIGENTKVSKIWGERKGMATKIDRILVLER